VRRRECGSGCSRIGTPPRQDKSLLFEETGSNLAIKFRAVLGDAAAACRNADYIRRETFRVQRHMALPMETRGLARAMGTRQAGG